MLYMIVFLTGYVLGVVCAASMACAVVGSWQQDDDPQPLGEAVGGFIEFTDPGECVILPVKP